MNRIHKRLTVGFFNIEAGENFFSNFVSSYLASSEGSDSSRIFSLRDKKHLIKTTGYTRYSDQSAYSITVVRERNTWQAKATSGGKISSISLNQGIIGDPYFFSVVPERNLVLGFTSGPGGSLKSVARLVLEQFNYDRSQRVQLNFVPKDRKSASLELLPTEGELTLKVNSSSLADVIDDAPSIIRSIGSDTLFENNVQLMLKLPYSEDESAAMEAQDIVELINYFADHDGCLALTVKGESDKGIKVALDFGNTFVSYKTTIATRNSFIDESIAHQVIEEAFVSYSG
ncbi:hypothetical protein [uncultured Pelagimonas sp.]|uniref:hypothetical protein n=1 Tax=uncultured Pelagimonas sp. TaxID=1618102 RepID=UPI0026259A51|nr:hypothetical protein [uncultured Pelagimonas sp.]